MDESPENLLRYFEWLTKEHPGDDRWAEGLRLTERWFELIKFEKVTEEEFNRLFAEIESVSSSEVGAGLMDLWLRVRNWGKELGFSVPDRSPWDYDTSVITCIIDDGFTGQLKIGGKYHLIDERQNEALVRIRNNEGRLRWYPRFHFLFPEIQERKWGRKEN